MKLLQKSSGLLADAFITTLEPGDLAAIRKEKGFVFDWSLEKDNDVYKICLKADDTKILGLLSMTEHPDELRIHINLLEVTKENVGRNKKLDYIAGCLIAFACVSAFKRGYEGLVSLLPKTELIEMYQSKYGFRQYGRLLALEHEYSKQVIDQYHGDE
jgi:hypothetical protein